ncbi:MAG: GGDEF domain-containing protein [Gammaproteobacteria bacterium]|nr:GGDEF domain-containing protein [Gammaproteobacteria bacterium]
MSNDGYEQLSAVVGLSQQKDGLALTRAMIRSLGELSPGTDVVVLEVYGRRNLADIKDLADFSRLSIRRFDLTGQRGHKDEGCKDDLLDVIRRLQPVEMACGEEGGGRIIIPLWGDIGPLRLVSLQGIDADPWVRSKVMQVVEIYGNLVRMMDSRERDALTGLLNRQTFAALFELAKSRVDSAAGHVLTLAVLDIDHFKRVNDTYGHLFGDEVLIHFSRLMERSFRYTDDLFRFGGEEFVVLLATDTAEGARGALERFRGRVEDYDFPGVGKVTVSVGYVTCSGSTLPTTLVDQADRALYFAKENGRNRVVDFAELHDQAEDQSGDIDLF